MNRKRYLCAYDIPDDKRRATCLRILKDYAGDRQKSVFDCELTPHEKDELVHLLLLLMDEAEDTFFIMPLPGAEPCIQLGTPWKPGITPDMLWIG